MKVSLRRLVALIVLVVAVSVAVLYWTVDLETLAGLALFHPLSLLAVLLAIAAGMLLDASRLVCLTAVAGHKVKLYTALQVVFGNYFMAMLTPGATGGALIQVLFLRKAGIPTGSATVIVLARTILSIFFLLVCLPLVFYFDPHLLPWFEPAVTVRLSILLAGAAVLAMAALRTGIADRLAVVAVKRFPVRWRLRLLKVYRDMRGALALMAASPGRVVRAFVESGASLLLLYSMVPLLFRGLGATLDWFQVMGRMIFLNLLLYFAPTPGGAGVAEGLFIAAYRPMLPLGFVGITAVAWRIFAEYLPAIVGGYFTVKVFGVSWIRNGQKVSEGEQK